MRATAEWVDYRLFEYERRLASSELLALGATELATTNDGVAFEHPEPETLAARLTYFARVTTETSSTPCAQRTVELVHLADRVRPQRQATRFGVHGFHEYKGKFNPQLARALLNAVDPDVQVVVDPFVGSGTTLIETLRLGAHARGRDRSPIAVFMAQVKTETMQACDPEVLANDLLALADEVGGALKRGQDRVEATAVPWLSGDAHNFLGDWFTAPAYAGLTRGLAEHTDPTGPLAARLSLLALSSLLRQVSLQEPQDLRVRRRPAGFVAPSLRDAYVEKVDRLVASIAELTPWGGTASVKVSVGNADDPDVFEGPSGRRMILTSPPYATALPYIDTDRLSLISLGLTAPRQLRVLEAGLTGSREWSTSEGKRWWDLLLSNAADLPTPVNTLLHELAEINRKSQAGFRRAAVPPLLYRYFSDMRECFVAWAHQLERGEHAVVVVGRNRTGPAGAQITIDTPTLLGCCARQVGFEVENQLPLETWPRYGLHAANAVQGEDALVLRRV